MANTIHIPTPLRPPTGCVFHTRCPIARFPICAEQVPALLEHKPDQFAACHFAGEKVPEVKELSAEGREGHVEIPEAMKEPATPTPTPVP